MSEEIGRLISLQVISENKMHDFIPFMLALMLIKCEGGGSGGKQLDELK